MAYLWIKTHKEALMAQISAQTKLHMLIDQKMSVPLEVFLQLADEEGADTAWIAYCWTRDRYRRNA
jgi:hypothetical protein